MNHHNRTNIFQNTKFFIKLNNKSVTSNAKNKHNNNNNTKT